MSEQESGRDPGRTRIVAVTVAAGLALYGLTCAPGVVWQDGAMFQFRVWHGDLQGDLGLPLAHPLYILLAKAFTMPPLGGFAWRVNLFSAVCGAACLGFAVDLLLSLTRCRIAAITGTILLAVSHTFWTHAVIAEVYDLYALGLVAELWLLERFFTRRQARWLTLALLINGLNLSNHLLALLHAPVYAGVMIWALRTRCLRARQLPQLAIAFFLGSLPYSALVIADIVAGQPLVQTVKQALVGPPGRAEKVLGFAFPFVRQATRSLQYFAMNFPTPLAVLAPVGAYLAWKERRTRWFAAVGGTFFATGFVFAFRYLVPDQYAFFMPCYVLFALFVALAIARLVAQSKARQVVCLALAALPIAVYEAAPALMKARNISIGVKREIPLRDSYTYFLRPRKNGDDSAVRFARAALGRAAPEGLVIADTTINNVLVYVRDVEGLHPNVTLTLGRDIRPAPPAVLATPEGVRPFVERGAAYVCSDTPWYVRSWILDEYNLVPAGHVFRLEPK